MTVGFPPTFLPPRSKDKVEEKATAVVSLNSCSPFVFYLSEEKTLKERGLLLGDRYELK